MAITITTSLDANVAAFAPVTIAGTTTRNPFTDGVRQGGAITLLDENGGYLRITTTTTAWIVDDTVLITDATGDYAQYNGRHKVTSIAIGYVLTTATTWDTATTGDEGNVYRMNENLMIKANIKNSSSTVIATVYSFVDTLTGAWSFDLCKPLQYELGSIFDMTPGEISTALASHSYTVDLYETYQAPNYSVTESAAYTPSPAIIAHRTTELKTDFVNGVTLMTGNFFHGGKILVHFLMNAGGSSIQLKFTEADGTVTNSGALTETNWHYGFVFETTSEVVKVAVWDVTEGTRITQDIYVRKIGCASTILYYVNRYGGYEGYEIHDFDAVQKAEKVEQYTGKAWQERSMQGKEYTLDVYQNIRDLITSPEVYDEYEIAVEVLSESLTYRSQEVNPKITIKYKENFIQ